MTSPRILIACIGNIFLGDDGFGVEVARRMAGHPLPEGVRVEDFGIRGFDLAFALLNRPEMTILVDTCPRGDQPGSVYLVEPDLAALDSAQSGQDGSPAVDAHSMNPMSVLRMVKSMGGEPTRILIVGCEPADFGPEEGQMGLSEPVEAAVDVAVRMIEKLVSQILAGEAVNTECSRSERSICQQN